MASLNQYLDGELIDLLKAEMVEQDQWHTYVAAWHPTMRVEDPPADPPQDPPADPPADPPQDPPDEAAARAQAAVDAAYEKLRAAEKERDQFKAQATKLSRAGMEENERLKAEAEDARNEAAALQERLDRIEWEGTVRSLAEEMKFKKPAMALRFVETTTTDPKAIKKELEAAIKDLPELALSGEPPPPVNDPTKPGGSENDRMNSMLRAATGRGAAR